jgi:hypothetical protein
MAKPHIHAMSSAKRYGGSPVDYIKIHDWFDETKSWIPDNRHRAIRHHAEGIFQCMKIFGDENGCIENSHGKKVSVRDIGEQHVREDFSGFIPTAADYLQEMESQSWMSGIRGFYPPSAKKLQAAKQAREANTIELSTENEGKD